MSCPKRERDGARTILMHGNARATWNICVCLHGCCMRHEAHCECGAAPRCQARACRGQWQLQVGEGAGGGGTAATAWATHYAGSCNGKQASAGRANVGEPRPIVQACGTDVRAEARSSSK